LNKGIPSAPDSWFGFDAGLVEGRREGFAERFMFARYQAQV
jgi:hypothetical protein